MFNCKMIINRLHIEDTRMEIGVAINCPFDVDVSSPKARILFECDGQTRRLPLRVVNYFRQKQEGSCIVVCNYTYLLDQIFYRFQPESPVTITIDFEYGRHTVQALPFTVSTNVLHENPGLELPEEYMEYECFDGATVFDAPDNEYVPPAQTGNRTYTFDFDCENSAILLFSKKKKNGDRPFVQRSRVLVPLLRFIDFALRCLLALLLLPLFLFDGILAGLDIVPRRKTAPIEGVGKTFLCSLRSMCLPLLKPALSVPIL